MSGLAENTQASGPIMRHGTNPETMRSAPRARPGNVTPRERQRLAALMSLDILQGPREPILERIVRLARDEFNAQCAAIVLIDRSSAIFQTRIGTTAMRCAREGWPCNLTIQGLEPLIIQDVTTDPRTLVLPEVPGAPPLRSYAGFPLITPEGLVVGTLAVFSKHPGRIPEDRKALGKNLAAIIMNAFDLHRLASRDPLTGVLNRRGFMDLFERELRRAVDDNEPLSLAMMDIDHFKAINDTFGHGIGDEVLRKIAAEAGPLADQGVPVGRLGGEEFAFLMPGLTGTRAVDLIETFRESIAQLVFPDVPQLAVTASFGVAERGVATASSVQMLAQADTTLYDAKAAGRNRVILW